MRSRIDLSTVAPRLGERGAIAAANENLRPLVRWATFGAATGSIRVKQARLPVGLVLHRPPEVLRVVVLGHAGLGGAFAVRNAPLPDTKVEPLKGN